jgi:hypothetical protein
MIYRRCFDAVVRLRTEFTGRCAIGSGMHPGEAVSDEGFAVPLLQSYGNVDIDFTQRVNRKHVLGDPLQRQDQT